MDHSRLTADRGQPQLFVYTSGHPERAIPLWPTVGNSAAGVIQEARDYVLELRGVNNPDQVDLFIDDWRIEALRSPSPETARWRWSPGFYAGRIELRLSFGPGSVPVETSIVTDPDRDKLTRENFELLIRDVLEDTLALFSLSGFRTGVARGSGRDVPTISQLEFLRSRITELEAVIREINTRPITFATY